MEFPERHRTLSRAQCEHRKGKFGERARDSEPELYRILCRLPGKLVTDKAQSADWRISDQPAIPGIPVLANSGAHYLASRN